MIQVPLESKQGAQINLFLFVSSKKDEYSSGWKFNSLSFYKNLKQDSMTKK